VSMQLLVNEFSMILSCKYLPKQESYTDLAPDVKRLNERCIANGEEVTSLTQLTLLDIHDH